MELSTKYASHESSLEVREQTDRDFGFEKRMPHLDLLAFLIFDKHEFSTDVIQQDTVTGTDIEVVWLKLTAVDER